MGESYEHARKKGREIIDSHEPEKVNALCVAQFVVRDLGSLLDKQALSLQRKIAEEHPHVPEDLYPNDIPRAVHGY